MMSKHKAAGLLPIILLAVTLASPGVCQETDAAGLPVVSKAMSSDESVRMALANNPTIAARRAVVAAFAARARTAGSATKLQLSTTSYLTTATDQMIMFSSPGVTPTNITLVPNKARAAQNFMLMYPLYTGGKLRSNELSARSEIGSASAEAALAELNVALAAKIAYYQSLLARRYVDAFTRRVNESQERVRIAEEAYSIGKVAKYDLLRNRTDLADSQQQLVNAQRDTEIADAETKRVLGISQDSVLTPTDSLEAGHQSAAQSDLQTEALAHRPEIAAARANAAAAESKLRAAKGDYMPQVYAVAMQNVAGINDKSFDHSSLVGVTASLPLLDGGLRRSTVEEAQAMLDQAHAEERDAALTVTRDVATACSELNAAVNNVALAQAAVDQADEDYLVIEMRYEAGKSINVEVLDALTALVRAQTNRADAVFQFKVAQAKLERAVGRY